jgi:hypothetical protein
MPYVVVDRPKKLGEEYALGGFGIGLDSKLLLNRLPKLDMSDVTEDQKAKFCGAVKSWLGQHPVAAEVLRSPECGICPECPVPTECLPTECPSCKDQGYLTPDECSAMKAESTPAEEAKGKIAWWWLLVAAGVGLGAGYGIAKMK